MGTLGAEYLRGWFRSDPLFAIALDMAPGSLRRIDSREIADAMSAEYRAIFYVRPALASNSATLAAGTTLRLAVNFYQARDAPLTAPPALESIFMRLALAHLEARA